MTLYYWTGKNTRGTIEKGQMEAINADIVKSQLIKMRIVPISIKKKKNNLFNNFSLFQPKVSKKDIILFVRQLSTMINAGLTITQCLDILQAQHDNKAFKKILIEIRESVERGATLAESFKKFPRIFDDLFVNMVAAGEYGGVLDTILRRIYNHMEKGARLKAKIKSAMTYPLASFFIAFVVLTIILVFVVPVFQEMFSSFGKELPLLTQAVVWVSHFLKGNILYIIGIFSIAIIILKRLYNTQKGIFFIDHLLLKLPIFGRLIQKTGVAKFTRTLGTMLASGVTILEALDIVSKTLGNKVMEQDVHQVRTGVAEGKTMAELLAKSLIFPPMVSRMINVGEYSGALDSMMIKIADFYDEEIDEDVERLTSLIEPIMIVFLGLVIGTIVVAMYMPIFKMAGAVSG